MLGVFNNLDDFEDIIEDAKEGIFEDFFRMKDLLQKDQDISMLLKNELMSFTSVVLNELQQSFAKKVISFVILFLLAFKLLKVSQKQALIFSVVFILVYKLYSIISKLIQEEVI